MASPEGVFCSCSSFLNVSSQRCGALAYFVSFPDSGQVYAVLADGNRVLILGGVANGLYCYLLLKCSWVCHYSRAEGVRSGK